MPEQREKLLEEIKENFNELEFLVNKTNKNENSDSESMNQSSNDDVFEDSSPNEKEDTLDTKTEKWNDLYDSIEKLSYLDMFVREVLR